MDERLKRIADACRKVFGIYGDDETSKTLARTWGIFEDDFIYVFVDRRWTLVVSYDLEKQSIGSFWFYQGNLEERVLHDREQRYIDAIDRLSGGALKPIILEM